MDCNKRPCRQFYSKIHRQQSIRLSKNQQRILKGEYGEIFLTNKFGALVASTAKLSTLAHGHKYWWLGSYNNGEGAIFLMIAVMMTVWVDMSWALLFPSEKAWK